MKTRLLTLFTFISFFAISNAQMMDVTVDSMVIESEELNTSYTLYGYMINTHTDTVKADWDVAGTNQLPQDWAFSNSFCFTRTTDPTGSSGGACIDLVYANSGPAIGDLAPGDSIQLKWTASANGVGDTVYMDLTVEVEEKGNSAVNESRSVVIGAAFKADENVGIFEKEQVQFEVYPNPTINTLYIKGELNNIDEIEIYNIIGSKILSTPFSNQIDVSYLPSGVYLTKVKNSENTILGTRTFIKK